MTKGTQEKTLLSKLAVMSQEVEAPCPLGKIHKRLDKETAQAFISALQSPASTTQIHKALISEGFSIARTTLNHKRHCFKAGTDDQCLCFPNNLEKKQ